MTQNTFDDKSNRFVGNQAITWANADKDLCRHIAPSLPVGHNELNNTGHKPKNNDMLYSDNNLRDQRKRL